MLDHPVNMTNKPLLNRFLHVLVPLLKDVPEMVIGDHNPLVRSCLLDDVTVIWMMETEESIYLLLATCSEDSHLSKEGSDLRDQLRCILGSGGDFFSLNWISNKNLIEEFLTFFHTL